MEQQNESDQPQKLYDTRSVASKTKTSRSSRSSTSSAATKARASAEAALVEAKYAAREAEMMKVKAKIEAEAAQRKAELEASLYVLKIERSATAAAAEAAVYEGAAAVEGSSLEDLAQIPPEDTAQHTSEYVKAHYVTPDAQQPAPVPQQPLTTSTPAPRASLPAPPSSVQWYPLPGTVTNQPTTIVNAPCHSSRSLSLSNQLDNRLRERSTQQRQIPPPWALPAPLLPPCSSSGCACTVGVLHTISRCPVRPARQRSPSTRDIPQLLALPAPTTPAASSALAGRLQVEGTTKAHGDNPLVSITNITPPTGETPSTRLPKDRGKVLRVQSGSLLVPFFPTFGLLSHGCSVVWIPPIMLPLSWTLWTSATDTNWQFAETFIVDTTSQTN
uniref:uncharacterized protein LOC131127531 isoform X7 n=1 Tax=Doryrhamphus excisus TaxID=161450 RepID=UPI0025AEB017|nr:uncharacterized protein LOC131127531 isoform X7 [Doryrhamphus excisus]